MDKRASAIRTMAAAVVGVLAAHRRRVWRRWSKPAPNCLQVAACGGDIVGTWTFIGTCTDVGALNDQLAAGCPGAAFTAFGIAVAGSFTFNADLTYTASNWREDFLIAETLPLMCHGGPTCADADGDPDRDDGRIDVDRHDDLHGNLGVQLPRQRQVHRVLRRRHVVDRGHQPDHVREHDVDQPLVLRGR